MKCMKQQYHNSITRVTKIVFENFMRNSIHGISHKILKDNCSQCEKRENSFWLFKTKNKNKTDMNDEASEK